MNSHPRSAQPAAEAAAPHRNGGGRRRLLPLTAYLTLLVACAAVFSSAGSAAKAPAGLSTPNGLQTFLQSAHASRTPSAAGAIPTYSRTPAFAWNPVRGATRYEYQLSTSEDFLSDNALIWSAKMTSPAASVPLALPWISGEPASLFWRVRGHGPKGYSKWSNPSSFNMRWTEQPHPLTSGPGYIRWSTVDGATAYQVWFLNAGDPKSTLGKTITTITNVADEREYYLTPTIPSTTVYWRVRAERKVYGAAKNHLPAVSYGPWSHIFKATNPAPATELPAGSEVVSPTITGDPLDDKYVRLQPLEAVSDVTSTANRAKRHTLVPAVTVGGNPTSPKNLYRIYMFTDRDCVNRVFTGPAITSPAYAPRSSGAPALPTAVNQMADGTKVTPTELGTASAATTTGGTAPAGGPPSPSGATTGSPAAASAAPAGPAKIDLWDTRGRYFVVAVPVVAADDTGAPVDPSDATTPPTLYQDLALPQDLCENGLFLTFGKASRTPLLSSRGVPTATGLSPNGRLLSAVRPKPKFYGSPLVTWGPASGAIGYQVQWSKQAYPWRAAGSIKTPATSATLPLTPGVWWYRVRGVNDSLPGNQLMSWSTEIPIVITRPTFGVLNG